MMKELKKLPVELVALSVMEKGQDAYRLIRIKNCHSGKLRRVLIPSALTRDKRKFSELLLKNGLAADLNDKTMKAISNVLKSTPKEKVLLVMRPGFFNVNDALCYMTRSGKVYGEYEGIKPMPYPETKAFGYAESRKGDLAGWKKHVAVAAKYSDVLMLSLCTAFAGYCIHFTGTESGGFHLYGDSSMGKSTALNIAASVYGDESYVGDWNLTEAAFEELAESRNNGFLPLDELVMIDTKAKNAAEKRQKLIYALSDGQGKGRAASYQGRRATWHLTVLSNGESAMEQHAMEGDLERKNGERARLVDVPADAGHGMGIFDSLPDDTTPAQYAEKLKNACRDNHGVAGTKFVKKLLMESTEQITSMLDKRMSKFLRHIHIDGHNGLEKRIAGRFALVAASGMLVAWFGILPCTEQDVLNAIAACYMKAVSSGPTNKKIFNSEMLQKLEGPFHEANKENWDPEQLEKIDIIVCDVYPGKGRKGPEEKVLAIKKDYFEKNITVNINLAINVLRENGCFIPSARSLVRQIIKNGKAIDRRYCFKLQECLDFLSKD